LNIEPRVPFGKVEVITSKIWRSPPCLGWQLWNICITNDHGYVPFVVSTSRSFPHSRLVTGFVTRLTRRVPLVEQKLLTLAEHLSSLPVFSGVRVTWSLVLYVCFIDRGLSFCPFYFVHFVVCSSSIYGFWLPLWYLQTLRIIGILACGHFDIYIKSTHSLVNASGIITFTQTHHLNISTIDTLYIQHLR
jgi:hypothetical protein